MWSKYKRAYQEMKTKKLLWNILSPEQKSGASGVLFFFRHSYYVNSFVSDGKT